MNSSTIHNPTLGSISHLSKNSTRTRRPSFIVGPWLWGAFCCCCCYFYYFTEAAGCWILGRGTDLASAQVWCLQHPPVSPFFHQQKPTAKGLLTAPGFSIIIFYFSSVNYRQKTKRKRERRWQRHTKGGGEIPPRSARPTNRSRKPPRSTNPRWYLEGMSPPL